MKSKVKQLWLEALESGKYQQGKRFLRTNDNKFCCLGVLCDIYAKTQKKKGWSKTKNFDHIVFGKSEQFGILPEEVMKWSGLKDRRGSYSATNTLALDNDHGKSFKEIAQIINVKF